MTKEHSCSRIIKKTRRKGGDGAVAFGLHGVCGSRIRKKKMTLEEMKRIREERGYSLAVLSEYSGVPLGTLQKIFSGETLAPRQATVKAIERVLLGEEQVFQGKSYRYGERGNVSPALVQKTARQYVVRADASEILSQDGLQENAAADPRFIHKGKYTLKDYYALPEDKRVELIDGTFYDMSSPSTIHQHLAGLAYHQIISWIHEKKGSCIPFISPMDVQLDMDDKTMVEPDVMIVCDPSKIKRRCIYGAPDFLMEIVSPWSKKRDYVIKQAKYALAGVREYWIIDPDRNILIQYDFEGEGIPTILPLEGEAGLNIYGGECKINLSEMAEWIDRFSEE